MSKLLSGLVAAAFSGAIVLSAQEPAPRPAPGAGQAPGAQSAQASKTVTVSGCIRTAPPATAGAAGGGAAASAKSDAKFVLSMKPATGPGGAPAAGAVGTSGSASSYALDGEEKTISPHLNHQVEITGTLQTASASATSAGASASAAATPTLKVESLKMLSATCS
jgi:hypothetical protein